MSHNTFGHLFRITTWGESHGPAIGCIVDGCPPGLPLDPSDIQAFLDKRKPGGSKFVTQRREAERTPATDLEAARQHRVDQQRAEETVGHRHADRGHRLRDDDIARTP